jgi:hypothetical protein
MPKNQMNTLKKPSNWDGDTDETYFLSLNLLWKIISHKMELTP